jgi:hypothetical protein
MCMCRVGKVTRGQATEDKHVGENGREKKNAGDKKPHWSFASR